MASEGVIAKKVGTDTFWIHTDRQGSVNVVTDAAGLQVLRRTYRPYGEKQSEDGSHVESRGYIDQRTDAASGLTYLHARYYDARVGVFVSPDPLHPAGAGVGMNRYSYVFGNPVNGIDPSGLDCTKYSGTITDVYGNVTKKPELTVGECSVPSPGPEGDAVGSTPAVVAIISGAREHPTMMKVRSIRNRKMNKNHKTEREPRDVPPQPPPLLPPVTPPMCLDEEGCGGGDPNSHGEGDGSLLDVLPEGYVTLQFQGYQGLGGSGTLSFGKDGVTFCFGSGVGEGVSGSLGYSDERPPEVDPIF